MDMPLYCHRLGRKYDSIPEQHAVLMIFFLPQDVFSINMQYREICAFVCQSSFLVKVLIKKQHTQVYKI